MYERATHRHALACLMSFIWQNSCQTKVVENQNMIACSTWKVNDCLSMRCWTSICKTIMQCESWTRHACVELHRFMLVLLLALCSFLLGCTLLAMCTLLCGWPGVISRSLPTLFLCYSFIISQSRSSVHWFHVNCTLPKFHQLHSYHHNILYTC